jgi:adenosylhomocysteine nucleosidase
VIAVTFALPAESREFLRRLSDKSQVDRNGIRVIRGRMNDRTIEVLHTGVGEKVCRQCVEKFLEDVQFDCLISTGFAGALTDDLHIGDVLLAKNFSTVDLDAKTASLSSFPIQHAILVTIPALIESSEERKEVARTTGAAAVDMETEFIARACARRGIPLLSLRVISDTPSERFPAPANVLFDIERQQTPMLRLARHFLARAHHAPRLVRFARRIARARKTLGNALIEVVRNIKA